MLFFSYYFQNKMKLLFFCLSFLVLAQILGCKGCLREERTALLHFKAFLNTYSYNESTNGYLLSSWIRDPHSDCCRWNRVTCNTLSGHVTELHLQEFQIPAGNISLDMSMFQAFTELRSLNLSSGYFSFLIHTEVLANMSNLEVLILKGNFLWGPLPVKGLCGLKNIRVLDLSDNSFEGPFPKCLGDLTSLQALDLAGNSLDGEIPASAIATLATLEYLSLSYNSFKGRFTLNSMANHSQLKVLALEMDNKEWQVDTEGEVPWVPSFQLEVLHMPSCRLNAPRGILPSFLTYQHDLEHLDLSDNNLVGEFPCWLLVNNTKLKSLILNENSFTGAFELPPSMDPLPLPRPLFYLKLAHNKIASELPEAIGHVFPNLKYLNLSRNELNGEIPTSIGKMSKLFALDLGKNNFSGEVPGSLWTGCAALRLLILSDNNLWGQPFSSPWNLSHLYLLFMDNNIFSGTLLHAKLNLLELGVVDISNNNFWGIVPDFIGNLSRLGVINLSRNNFGGALPETLCNLYLEDLLLSHNNFSGLIPSCFLSFPNLLTLHLQSNSLVGSIPQLKNNTDLTSLDLRDNNLSGTIPDWIGNATRFLRALLLGGNHLQGRLPNSLCQLPEINFLDLSRNNFVGSIPACFSSDSFGGWTDYFWDYVMIRVPTDSSYQYRHLHLQLYFMGNDYPISAVSSGLEVEFRTKDSLLLYEGQILRFMSGIDFSCNQLTGFIPRDLGNLASLRALNLSHNHLNGSIPASFHNLTEIESLDLSYNNLSGKIPPQLQDLNSLAVFNVSYNNLSGKVPDKGQFGTFDESSFRGNPHLILNNSNRGTTRPQPPPPPPTASYDGEDDDSVIDFTVFYWSFAASYVTVILLLITILWINPRWRRAWFYFIETCLFKCFHRILKDAIY